MYSYGVVKISHRKDTVMTVGFLVGMLTNETEVTIKDHETGKTLFVGVASAANFNDEVKDWDFSRGHVIYI